MYLTANKWVVFLLLIPAIIFISALTHILNLIKQDFLTAEQKWEISLYNLMEHVCVCLSLIMYADYYLDNSGRADFLFADDRRE